jgi:hypothetical protein
MHAIRDGKLKPEPDKLIVFLPVSNHPSLSLSLYLSLFSPLSLSLSYSY